MEYLSNDFEVLKYVIMYKFISSFAKVADNVCKKEKFFFLINTLKRRYLNLHGANSWKSLPFDNSRDVFIEYNRRAFL